MGGLFRPIFCVFDQVPSGYRCKIFPLTPWGHWPLWVGGLGSSKSQKLSPGHKLGIFELSLHLWRPKGPPPKEALAQREPKGVPRVGPPRSANRSFRNRILVASPILGVLEAQNGFVKWSCQHFQDPPEFAKPPFPSPSIFLKPLICEGGANWYHHPPFALEINSGDHRKMSTCDEACDEAIVEVCENLFEPVTSAVPKGVRSTLITSLSSPCGLEGIFVPSHAVNAQPQPTSSKTGGGAVKAASLGG